MTNLSAMRDFDASASYILNKIGDLNPTLGVVLGSGLGDFANQIEDKIEIPYHEIPDFPVSTVEGHKGMLVCGKIGDKRLVCMQGRFHFYEGYRISDVVHPIRTMALIGIKSLILTNAAGGVNTKYVPGTLMMINDHINLTGINPLIGPNLSQFGPRFPDMSQIYSKRLIDSAITFKNTLNIALTQGVYLSVAGPSYETPAEIRAFRNLGADAVGMSTVSEAIVARHCGMEVCGVSCITNMAAGLQHSLSHEEVTLTAQKVAGAFKELLKHIISSV